MRFYGGPHSVAVRKVREYGTEYNRDVERTQFASGASTSFKLYCVRRHSTVKAGAAAHTVAPQGDMVLLNGAGDMEDVKTILLSNERACLLCSVFW